MYICFLCKRQFPFIKMLRIHLRTGHNHERHIFHRCGQSNCNQRLPNIYSFVKHLKLKHSALETTNETSIKDECSHSDSSCIFENVQETDETAGAVTGSRNDLKNGALTFVANLMGNSSLPRKSVNDVLTFTSQFLNSEYVNDLKNKILSSLQDQIHGPLSTEVQDLFEKLQNPFNHLLTEYSRLKIFENSKHFIRPITVTVGERMTCKRIKGKLVDIQETFSLQLVPLRFLFQKFFELPNVLVSTLEYFSDLSKDDNSHISSFLRSTLWEKVESSFDNNLVLPIFIYFDDFETGNPLGSHAGIHKMGAVYVSLPFLHPRFSSKLQNIFLALLFHSSDRISFGNRAIFLKLVDELKYLENVGIEVSYNETKIRLHFKASAVLGDNLGLNSILGFSESFSANYYCRFCREEKNVCQKLTRENYSSRRNKTNYELDVLQNACGVKENCVFHDLTNFHVTENLSCDLMHDLLEGVCRYDLAKLLQRFVSSKFFSLELFNHRIEYFDFGRFNKPPAIKSEHLQKGAVIMSASEMLSLMIFFGLLIGDRVPDGDDGWSLFLLLREILDISMCQDIHDRTYLLLKTLIQEHHELYQDLFKEKLKPKYHLLTHYPAVMQKMGPLRNIWSMRFEAKHKELKKTANIVSSRVNIGYSLAMKHQLQLCCRFFTGVGLYADHTSGREVFVDSRSVDFTVPENSRCTSFIEINGIRLNCKMVVEVGVKDHMPEFGYVTHIFKTNNESFEIIYNDLKVLRYNLHIAAYELQTFDVHQSRSLIVTIENFQYLRPLYTHITEKDVLTVVKWSSI